MHRRVCLAAFGFALWGIACGGGNDGSTQDPGSPTGGGLGGGDNGGGSTPMLGSADAGPLGTADAACVTASTKAQTVPVSLVFMFDRSGSMDSSTKWGPCKAGLKAFFADPASAGLSASLQYFGDTNDNCSVSTYATPKIAMRPLPDAVTFANVINSVGIYSDGSTPTLPALRGALTYAQSVQAANGGVGKTAVVLVTDGAPNVCNSSLANVAAAAAAQAKTIPTYVIGVGGALTNLNAIAAAGGTGQATLIQTSNPAQVSADFEAAIGKIRGQTLACDYAVPAPPDGKTLDIESVNVVHTPSGGSPDTLTYNKDCAGGLGWHYDDPSAPKRIELCASSCAAVQKDANGRIDIALGCATKGGVPK